MWYDSSWRSPFYYFYSSKDTLINLSVKIKTEVFKKVKNTFTGLIKDIGY